MPDKIQRRAADEAARPSMEAEANRWAPAHVVHLLAWAAAGWWLAVDALHRELRR